MNFHVQVSSCHFRFGDLGKFASVRMKKWMCGPVLRGYLSVIGLVEKKISGFSMAVKAIDYLENDS
jgi:hypothetical protein